MPSRRRKALGVLLSAFVIGVGAVIGWWQTKPVPPPPPPGPTGPPGSPKPPGPPGPPKA